MPANVTRTVSNNFHNKKVSYKMHCYSSHCYNFARFKIDTYDSLPLGKTLILHNVLIHIKSVFDKDQKHYYYTIFSEKCSYQIAKK